jgi:hypothetical protein
MNDLRYPIGQFKFEGPFNENERQKLIAEIEETPSKLRDAVRGLSEQQLNTPYRPGGWTIRQVVHHLPDSHLNSYIRFKLALTEDQPTIKPYSQEKWAELHDYKNTPVEISLSLLEMLHTRWVILLRSMKESDFKKGFNHPEQGIVSLERTLNLYAWHGKHHVAHITSLRERMGW